MSDIATKAANWWADRIYGDPFDQQITSRDGADTASEQIEADVNFFLTLGRRKPDPALRPLFVETLARDIAARMAHIRPEYVDASPVTVSVDYGPSVVLMDAVKAANINSSCLPWKTVMWVYGNRVVVRLGYGGDEQEI